MECSVQKRVMAATGSKDRRLISTKIYMSKS
jgi:hypothetical protein